MRQAGLDEGAHMTATRPARPRIVVGVDGSEGAKAALRWAAQLARTNGAGLDIVAAWDFPSIYGVAAVPDMMSPQTDIEKSLARTIDEVFGDDRPADLRLKVLEGSATDILLTVSKGALMLVVGNRGLGGFAGMLLGSVSARVAEHASCPVLVVHGDGPPAP
jgi:nucleotide-binding universal stress UspA family protein